MTRVVWLITTSAAALCVTASLFAHPLPRFIWNASLSVPIGLYRLRAIRKFAVTELVAILPTA